MPFDGGPYVQAACFCDMVLEDKTGVVSLIRIIDTLTHTEAHAQAPEEMPQFSYNLTLVLMLKSGNARGRHTLRIVPELPSGETEREFSVTAYFEGEEKGSNLIANLPIVFKLEGLYWFRVYLEADELTAIPFRVKYNRVVMG